jgi:hypothetical protein
LGALRKLLYLGGAIVIGYLPQILKFIGFERMLSVMHIAAPVLAVLLSPLFPLVIVALAIVVLFWRAWPTDTSMDSEFFIEMLEQQIKLGRAILRQRHIDQMGWRTWVEKTTIDMSRYLPVECPAVQSFRYAGDPMTFEFDQGELWYRNGLDRQIRKLNELIDQTDSGELLIFSAYRTPASRP